LRNRRQLDGDVAIMWPSIRRGATSTVVMFDLDRFKRLNDERGHAAGDSTLRLVAVELQRQARGRDSVYRIGGEEFLVLLRDTTLEGGLQVADRIRTAIADLSLPSSGGANPTRLTISGGVAVADDGAPSWDAVVAAADAALYEAKAAGRDQVFGPAGQWVQAA
jgi:two-component system cell cycle response regulator